MAGGERDASVAGLLEHRYIARLDDLAAGHFIDELALASGDIDFVTHLELADVTERGAVGGAVPGNGGISGLTGQRSAAVVPWTLLQVGHAGSLHHCLGEVD